MSSHNNPQPGDIDARLQFLLQSTESLHTTVSEMTEQMRRQSEQIAEHSEQLKIDAENIRRLANTAGIDGENIRRLANVAGAHEERLDTLEEILTRLEGKKGGA